MKLICESNLPKPYGTGKRCGKEFEWTPYLKREQPPTGCKDCLKMYMKAKNPTAPTPKCLDCDTMMKLLNVGNTMWSVWPCKTCSDYSKFSIANKVFLLWNNELDAWEWTLEEDE